MVGYRPRGGPPGATAAPVAQQQVRLLTRAMAEHHRAYATQIRISDGWAGLGLAKWPVPTPEEKP